MTTTNKRRTILVKPLICSALVTLGFSNLVFSEVTAYGHIRLSVNNSREIKPANWRFDQHGNVLKKGAKATGMMDQGSRLGLTGQENLGDLMLLYHLEWGFNAASGGFNKGGGAFTQRLGYLTLKNELGALTIGKIENPFKQMLQVKTVTALSNGNWNSAAMSAAGDLFQGSMGSISNFNSTMMFRVGNAMLYTSPEWHGFNFDMAIIMAQKADTPNDMFNKRRNIDIFTANANYFHNSGGYIKAGYITGNTNKPGAKAAHVWGLSIGYVVPKWGVNLYGAMGETTGLATFGVGNERSQAYWGNVKGINLAPAGYKHKAYGVDLTAHYLIDEALTTKVFASISYGNATKKERQGLYQQNRDEKNQLGIWALGLEHKFSQRTKIWAEYESMAVKQSFIGIDSDYYRTKKLNNDRLLVGMRHDF